MVFDKNWFPSSREGGNSAVKAPSKCNSGDDILGLNRVSGFPLPPSDFVPLSSPSSQQSEDAYHTGISIQEDDIVIAVMGPTGVGKSSFVNKAAGRTEAAIGYSLKSQTRAVQPVRCQHPDGLRNIVLVDTPGFDDTHLSDSQILRIIANWLKDTYQSHIKLAGLLYLHRISDVRMAGTPRRNLEVFKDLCGTDNLKNILLVTTMWDELEDDVPTGDKREEELLSTFWKDMISHGSRTCRFEGTCESAWWIINNLDLKAPRPRLAPLQIQKEMVDNHLPLQETAAARTLLRSLTDEFKKVWTRLRNGARRTIASRKTSDGSLRRSIFSRSSSTLRSSFSERSWTAVSSTSLADTSSITSYDSEYSASPAGISSSSCIPNSRRNVLLGMITGLRLAYQMADIASILPLQGSIETVLQVTQLIEGRGGVHHVISQLLEHAGWLLEQIAQYAAGGSKLSGDTKKALSTFQREVNNLQSAMNIPSRSLHDCFVLYDEDIQAIMACTTSIKQIHDTFRVKLSIDSRQVIARLECQLTEMCENSTLRKCECGVPIVREE